MRAAAFRYRFGDSVSRAAAAHAALAAVAMLAGESGAHIRLFTDGHCRIGDIDYDLLILADAMPAGDVRQEAFRRAERLAGRGRIEGEAAFVVAGLAVGPLNHAPAPDLGDGEVEADDIFMGPRGIGVRFLSASEILGRAA